MFQLKATHKVVKDYFAEVQKLIQLGAVHEGAVAPAFANLLRAAAQPFGWTLAEQYARTGSGGQAVRIDGALLDSFRLARGYWEAKDSADDLDAEISRKLAAGYPHDNILFQSPARMVVVQQGQRVWDAPVETPDALVAGLRAFFTYQPPAFERWQQAVEEFKAVVPELAAALLELIEGERRGNQGFIDAFGRFADLCRAAINPNISDQAVLTTFRRSRVFSTRSTSSFSRASRSRSRTRTASSTRRRRSSISWCARSMRCCSGSLDVLWPIPACIYWTRLWARATSSCG